LTDVFDPIEDRILAVDKNIPVRIGLSGGRLASGPNNAAQSDALSELSFKRQSDYTLACQDRSCDDQQTNK
jgi:hypothetical protein